MLFKGQVFHLLRMKRATQKLNQMLTKDNFLTGLDSQSSTTSKPEMLNTFIKDSD